MSHTPGRLGQQPSSRPLPLQIAPLVGAVFFSVFGRTIFSPLLPIMERELHISHSHSGSFFFFISIGYSTSMMLSGFVSHHITHRWTVATAMFISSFGLMLVAATPTLALLPVAFLVLGIGAGMYPPSGLTTLMELVDPKRWGLATAIHEIGPNLAFILSPFFVSFVLLFAGWRAALWGTSLAAALTGVLYLRVSLGGRFAGVPPHLKKIASVVRERYFLVILVLFLIAMSGFLGLYSMLPSYLVAERGMDPASVNRLVGLSRVTGLLMIFLAGGLADRMRADRLYALVLLVVGVSMIGIGLLRGTWLAVAIVIEATAAAAYFPIILTILTRICAPETRSLTYSVTIAISYIVGAGVVPYLLGVMAEVASFSLGIVIIGVLTIAGIRLTKLLPRELM